LELKPAPADLEIESHSCLVCGSDEKTVVATAKDYDAGYDIEWNIVQCQNCGFHFTDPRPTMDCMLRYFYPEDYVCYQRDNLSPLTAKVTDMRWNTGMYLLKREIEKILPDPAQGRILDVGCAHGQILEFLMERTGWDMVGVEPVREIAEQAIKTGAEVHVATLEEAGLDSDSFDVVMMSHVLEHVDDPDVTVREARRILKPGGCLLAFMPDHDGEDRKRLGSLWWGYHVPRHLYHFDHISISQLLEQRGFEVLKVRDTPFPNLQAWNIEYQARGRGLSGAGLKLFSRYNPALWPAATAMGIYFRHTGNRRSGIMQVVARKSVLWDSIPDEVKKRRLKNENAMYKRRGIEALRMEKRKNRSWEERRFYPAMLRRNRPLMKRFSKYALKNLLTGKPTFWGADLAITYGCNFNCRHCFAKSSLADPGKKPMNTQQWKDVIKHLLEADCIFFQMQGGEPLTHPDLYELIEACEPGRSLVNVITNGVLVTEEHIRRFAELGIIRLEVSLDSAIAAEHAAFRGISEKEAQEVFDHCMWVVKRAWDYGIGGGIYTTVSTESLWTPGVQELISYCRENRIAQYFSVAAPVGAWQGRYDLLINAVDREYLRLMCEKDPLPYRDITPRRAFSYGCPAVKETLYFTPYGDVCPCPYTHISLGNILEEPVMEIRRRAMKVPQYRDRVDICPVAEDHSFIGRYISKTYGADLPADGRKIFDFHAGSAYSGIERGRVLPTDGT